MSEATEDDVIRSFTTKYAIIYANEFYDKLRSLEPSMDDLQWTKNDLINARPTVEMFGIPSENVFELVDCTYEQVQKLHSELKNKIREHEK